MRRSKRGTGRFGGRIWNTITNRPLKVVSAGLGVATIGEILLSGSATGDGVNSVGHIMNAFTAAKAGNNADVAYNLQQVPKDISAGIMGGTWLAPAAGAVITGVISRKFRI